MKIAYFEPFSGASGDMTLGALVDAGASIDAVAEALNGLNLNGWELTAEHASQNGIAGTRVHVAANDLAHSRTWATIRGLIEASTLADSVKRTAIRIFERLAIAEAAIHDSTPDEVHFHEVGGIDAIIDICGAAVALDLLGIEAVYSAPPRLGSGFARSMHGVIPIPAPATLKLMTLAGAPIAPANPRVDDVPGELLTPTGAAILTTLATFDRPAFTPAAIGYGYGTREFPWPNALRVTIGEVAADPSAVGEVLIETNLDDMNPQFVELLIERLFEAGALDAWSTPILMKKGRPAITVSAIAAESVRDAIASMMIEQSSTLGVRIQPIERVKAGRRFETVTTRWGDVRVKLRIWNGRVIDASPEYDDCAAIARAQRIPVRDPWMEARRLANTFIDRSE